MLRMRGEDVNIQVNGDLVNPVPPGQISVTNTLGIDAGGAPDFSSATPSAGRVGQGGNVLVSVQQGSLTAGGTLAVTAQGLGEDGLQSGGDGRGGTIDIGVGNKGTISAAGFDLNADGRGGSAFGSTTLSGGDGFGGKIDLHDDGGTLSTGPVSAPGDVFVSAIGLGGTGGTTVGGATGGLVAVRVLGQTQTWNNLIVAAGAEGGQRQFGATVYRSVTGQAGGVLLSIGGSGALNVSSVTLDNSAHVNVGASALYSAKAGGADLQVSTGGSLTVAGGILVQADAGLPGDPTVANVVRAPNMTGGQSSVGAGGGTITATEIRVTASAMGPAGQTSGATIQGGTAVLSASAGGSITANGPASVTGTPALLVQAEARGESGAAPANAIGGTARVTADNGTISTTDDIAVSASALGETFAFGSTTGSGYNAKGGSAALEVLTGTGSISARSAFVYAKGEASRAVTNGDVGYIELPDYTIDSIVGIDGNGGTGTGGAATVSVFGGSLTVTSGLQVHATGVGGASSDTANLTAWQSGTGAGGTASLFQTGGAIVAPTIEIRSSGDGGGLVGTSAQPGRLAANGGNGVGGFARASLSGGTMTLNTGSLLRGLEADPTSHAITGNGGEKNH